MSCKSEVDNTAPVGDEKLQRVVQALTSAVFVCGACERFPMPLITFRDKRDGDEDDNDDDLLLPLRQCDVHKIKARATAIQQNEGVEVSWDVDGALLESRNPKWLEFLNEWLTSQRTRLAIAPSAQVEMKLSKLVLAEAGAQLYPRREGDTRGTGVFGRLLVVLPGTFAGGDLVAENKENHDEGTDEGDIGSEDIYHDPQTTTATWQPAVRENDFGIAYTAFHDSWEFVSKPVRDGAALCLVYDIVTTTPSKVPFIGGANGIQQSVSSALVDYFDAPASPLANRFEIPSDTWRSIYDFIVQRQFVYAVQSVDFDHAVASERKIFEGLAAFCEKSRGQYVLYHASLFCSKDNPCRRNEDAAHDKMFVTLAAPWIKHGTSETFNYPPLCVRHEHELAPSKELETAPFCYRLYDTTVLKPLQGHLSKLHGNFRNAMLHVTSALVVLPASIESSQFGKLPLQDVADKLMEVFAKSRDEALAYARRVIHNRDDWHLTADQMSAFEEFVKIVIEIDDLQLFTDLLLVVHLKTPANELASGVEKFGWDACADALVKSIRSTPTFRGRVCLILSVCYERIRSDHVNQLIDTLLSLHPWTDMKTGRVANVDSSYNTPDVADFVQLLAVTRVHCAERIQDIVSFPSSEELIGLAMPALARFNSEDLDEPAMRAALNRVLELVQKC